MVAARTTDPLPCPLVLLASLYSFVRLMIGLVALTRMAQSEKDAEILALRHEVAVLRRRIQRPDLFATGRAIFAALGRHLPAGRLMFQPATPAAVAPRAGQAEVGSLSAPPPSWPTCTPTGIPSIDSGDGSQKPTLGRSSHQGRTAQTRYQSRCDRHPDAATSASDFTGTARGGARWRQFIRAHTSAIIATDLFTIDTVFLHTIYVIVFIELGSRRLLWADCTTNPDSAWVTQQARNVPYELQDLSVPVRFAIHDRDAKFTSGFDAILNSEGVEVIRTPYGAPRANSHCERSIGSARREFFDFVIVIGERHRRLLLDLWRDHYNRGRPHMALDLVAPDPRPTAVAGAIVRERKLFGLTTEYSRAA